MTRRKPCRPLPWKPCLPFLPDAARRWIPDAKIRGYLLSQATPKARSRHDFFIRFGFAAQHWRTLQAALMAHAAVSPATAVRADAWGTTYALTGPLPTPDGRNPIIIAYWIIRADDPRPQLTSVVPEEK